MRGLRLPRPRRMCCWSRAFPRNGPWLLSPRSMSRSPRRPATGRPWRRLTWSSPAMRWNTALPRPPGERRDDHHQALSLVRAGQAGRFRPAAARGVDQVPHGARLGYRHDRHSACDRRVRPVRRRRRCQGQRYQGLPAGNVQRRLPVRGRQPRPSREHHGALPHRRVRRADRGDRGGDDVHERRIPAGPDPHDAGREPGPGPGAGGEGDRDRRGRLRRRACRRRQRGDLRYRSSSPPWPLRALATVANRTAHDRWHGGTDRRGRRVHPGYCRHRAPQRRHGHHRDRGDRVPVLPFNQQRWGDRRHGLSAAGQPGRRLRCAAAHAAVLPSCDLASDRLLPASAVGRFRGAVRVDGAGPGPGGLPAAQEGRVSLPGAGLSRARHGSQTLHAEWTKLRTLASTGWLLLAVAVLTIAVSAAADASATCQSGGCQTDLTKLSLTGVQVGQAIVAIVAVLAVSNEYSSGMIQVTLAAVPRRLTVLAAKAALIGGLFLAAGAVAVLASVLAGRLILPGHGFTPAHGYQPLSLGDGLVLRAACGSVLYLVLIALLSLGVATVVRESAVAIGLVLGLLYVFPVVASVVSNQQWHRHLEQIGPITAGLYIQDTVDVQALPLTPWQGLGVLALWAAGALTVGALVLRLRDA